MRGLRCVFGEVQGAEAVVSDLETCRVHGLSEPRAYFPPIEDELCPGSARMAR